MAGGSVTVLRLVLLVCVLVCAPRPAAAAQSRTHGGATATATAWVNHGGGLVNWRYAGEERKLSPETAHRLALRWEYVAGGDVSATPAIYKGALYFPSRNGLLHAVDQKTGAALWSSNLTESTGLVMPTPLRLATGSGLLFSRSTPVVYRDTLLVGIVGPGAVAAFDRHTGRLLWTRVLDAHPFAIVTQGGTAYKGNLYIGVSSMEELAAVSPDYPCCTFIGSLAKVDIRTGTVLWTTLTLPDNAGRSDLYAGAAVWGSSPAIDRRRRLVYIATGNTYRAPEPIEACAANATLRNVTAGGSPDPCVEPDNFSNGVIAIALRSGAVKWGRNLGGFDAWTAACLFGGRDSPNCPPGPAQDYDFGQAPMLLTIPTGSSHHHGKHHHHIDVAVVAQKSGIVWALDRDTGAEVWAAVSGPDGFVGGAMWGSATDGAKVFVTNANSVRKNYTLVPSGEVITGGAWVGLDAASGNILWTTAAPNNTGVTGPVTLANGVLLGSSDNLAGDVYALDAATGDILWHSDLPVGTVKGGFSVSKGCAYIGAGYVLLGQNFERGTSVYAFCVD